MKIVLATPLYPPDIAKPAPYIKELARRLLKTHTVAIVTYGEMPEAIAGATITAISKRQPRLVRLVRYGFALWRAAKQADLLYAENGASVELPLYVVSFLTRTPIVMHLGDERAHAHTSRDTILRYIEHAALGRAGSVVTESPLPRPEIMPFAEYPTEAFAAYEASWGKHSEDLKDIFSYAR